MAGNVSRAGRSADTHDAYRDMRLDIDNMTYEVNVGLLFFQKLLLLFFFIYNLVVCFMQELLALEERMGKVSTGVTEENISK